MLLWHGIHFLTIYTGLYVYICLVNSWRWHVGHRWHVEDKAQGERAQGAQRVRPTVKGFICLVVVVFCHHCGRNSPGLSPSPSSSKRSFSSTSRRWSFAFAFPPFHHVQSVVANLVVSTSTLWRLSISMSFLSLMSSQNQCGGFPGLEGTELGLDREVRWK